MLLLILLLYKFVICEIKNNTWLFKIKNKISTEILRNLTAKKKNPNTDTDLMWMTGQLLSQSTLNVAARWCFCYACHLLKPLSHFSSWENIIKQ